VLALSAERTIQKLPVVVPFVIFIV